MRSCSSFKMRMDIKTFHTLGCSRIDLSPDNPDVEGLGFEALDGQIEQAMEAGCIMQADTIEELAEKLGMDSSTLSVPCRLSRRARASFTV